MSEAKTFEVVQDYYGKVLSTSKDLKTSACTSCDKPPQIVLDTIKKIPREVWRTLTSVSATSRNVDWVYALQDDV